MRRTFFLVAVFALLGAPVAAQIGKNVPVQAGSPEDKALTEIDATSDTAQKLALLDKFLAEFGKGDLALLAYERYIGLYLAAKDSAKVFEYGDKLLAVDPDNFNTAFNLFRTAEDTGDQAKMFDYGERVGSIVQRFKAQPPPEDTAPGTWEQRKAQALADIQENLNYTAYALLKAGMQIQNPAERAVRFERYAAAFPDSIYTENAEGLVFASYRQAQDSQKMLAFAQKVLTSNPNNVGMLLALADYWSEKGEQLEKAEEYAKKALDLLAQASKPEQVPEEQWQQQVALKKGLAYSIKGQVYVTRDQNAQAVDAFRTASPLLKPDPNAYARNLYRLGFTLAKMKRTAEARTVLTEAVSVNSPYKALAQDVLNKIGGATTTRHPTKRP